MKSTINFITGKFLKCTSISISFVVLISLSGCSIFSSQEKAPEKKAEIYGVSFRQLPPEPIYNRVRLVYLPDIKPALTKPDSNGTVLDPLVKLSLKNNTLEQAAIALASFGNYQPYTASSIAKQKVSLEAYGTLEEIATKLASKSGTHIVIDHPNRQIRILKEGSEEVRVKPSFAENDSSGAVENFK